MSVIKRRTKTYTHTTMRTHSLSFSIPGFLFAHTLSLLDLSLPLTTLIRDLCVQDVFHWVSFSFFVLVLFCGLKIRNFRCCEAHLEITREVKDRLGEGRACYNLGNVHHAVGKRKLNSNDPRSQVEGRQSVLKV